VKLQDFSFLADENIHPDVVAFLRARGCDVLDVFAAGLQGSEDSVLLQSACSMNRVVVTHDRDFGCLSIARLEPLIGIVFLRPGHINPQFTIETLRVLFDQKMVLNPPFLLVAKHAGQNVTMRLRNL